MQRVISPQAMQACEKHYFETSGVASIAVMERAAQALVQAALDRFPGIRHVCIACGPGGNGGDGYACARLLRKRGIDCIIFASAPARHPDAVLNARRAAECGVEIMDAQRLEGMPLPDLWIDCLYGTGFSRTPEGASAAIIRRIGGDHDRGCGVIACDIPSGLNGHTGTACELCVQADITIAFQLAKYGHFLQDGLDMCGEVIVRDVGFPDAIFPDALPECIESGDLRPLLPKRRLNIHKGGCGHLLIIAGSAGMAGAAALCAKAALRSGAGLVTVACPEEIVPILQVHAPCAMCHPLPQEDGCLSAAALGSIREILPGKSAVAIGPGLSRRVPPEILRAVLESGLPAAIDADALNILSAHPELKSLLRPHHVLTPHPGEAARLLERDCADPVADAQELAEAGASVVLKGASRVICASDRIFISTSGGCGMARGGSGDVLTGLLGGLLADRTARTAVESAACACEIHGLAGALAQEKYGSRAMNAADIIEFLPEVFTRYGE